MTDQPGSKLSPKIGERLSDIYTALSLSARLALVVIGITVAGESKLETTVQQGFPIPVSHASAQPHAKITLDSMAYFTMTPHLPAPPTTPKELPLPDAAVLPRVPTFKLDKEQKYLG